MNALNLLRQFRASLWQCKHIAYNFRISQRQFEIYIGTQMTYLQMTYTLSASLGKFLGTWVSPRCEQSTVRPAQEQAQGQRVSSPPAAPPWTSIGWPPIRDELEMSLLDPRAQTRPAKTTNNTRIFILLLRNSQETELILTLFAHQPLTLAPRSFSQATSPTRVRK